MLKTQSTVVDTLHGMQQFLDDNAAEVGPGLEVARATLDTTVATIETHFVQQDAGGRNALGATRKVEALKTALRFDHMRPIAEIAKRTLSEVPEFRALTLPPVQITTNRLLVSAQAMATAAQPYAQTFIELGLATDFLVQLQGAVDELAQTLAARKQHRAKQIGATAGLVADVTQGHSIIKLLDSLVRPRIRSNPALLTNWLATIRFHRTATNAIPAVSASSAAPAVTPEAVTSQTVTPQTAIPQTATVSDATSGSEAPAAS